MVFCGGGFLSQIPRSFYDEVGEWLSHFCAEVFLFSHKGHCHPVVDTEMNDLTFLVDHSSEAPINASVQF